MKPKFPKQLPSEPVEWDLSESFGVLPPDLGQASPPHTSQHVKSSKVANDQF
jgi:hypothetical protein